MSGELGRVEPSLFGALFDDVVDGFWIKRAGGDIAPPVDRPNTLPLSIFAASSQAFSASTGRPLR